MTDDTKRPMSTLGRAIFDMMNAHNRVFAASLGVRDDAPPKSMKNRCPMITEEIKRPSRDR